MTQKENALQTFRARIIDGLAAPSTGHALWLLLDGSLDDRLLKEAGDRHMRRLATPEHVQLDPLASPRFVLLQDGMDDRLFEQSISLAFAEIQTDPLCLSTGRSVCAWLYGESSAIPRLCGLGTARQPVAGARWIRWHDPRVLTQLWPTLSSIQRTHFLQDVSRYVVCDLSGHIAQLSAPVERVAESNGAVPRGWQFTAEQWERLSNTAQALQVAASLLPDASGRPADLVERMHRSLREAAALGFQNEDDVLACCESLWHFGPFTNEPEVQSALKSARLDPGSLRFQLAPLNLLPNSPQEVLS